jgi:hypothetical protein
MSSVWDPEVILRFDNTSGSQAAGAEWVSQAYSASPDEVWEIYRIEVLPPIDTTNNVIKKLRYITLLINGKEYETIRINSVMMPREDPTSGSVAIDLGVPYLHRPITGRIPGPFEGACPKVARGQTIAVKTIAEEEISQTYSIQLRAARVKGQDKLVEVVGTPVIDASFTLNNDFYPKAPVQVALDTFDELPGGLNQAKPQIFPWITYARNNQPTTPNQYYDFSYPNYVAYQSQNLSWNLVNKDEAYLVNALGVIPNANSKSLRLYIEGRVTQEEFPTLANDFNYFPPALTYSTTANAAIKRGGPRFLKKAFLFHGVKGGIQALDNGTSIPANGVEIHVYGNKFVLK